jgi:hypothetical protein
MKLSQKQIESLLNEHFPQVQLKRNKHGFSLHNTFTRDAEYLTRRIGETDIETVKSLAKSISTDKQTFSDSILEQINDQKAIILHMLENNLLSTENDELLYATSFHIGLITEAKRLNNLGYNIKL